ncbi:hypothetical protein DSO57_1030471 [Entomophthora muscae]|uniref:Uncharacterized protein n=1 Tax=Entomophthora muscae TaxID=34485 RepID=A0ACC2RRV3_9FUNG|nr:hypothetical protein DSO57_1030471 [Entomophthora muscae]
MTVQVSSGLNPSCTWPIPRKVISIHVFNEVIVMVENQMEGIARSCKTQNQQRTADKPLKEIDNLNAVIDKKWVKAEVAQIALENLDLPYFFPNNYDKKITRYTLFGDGCAQPAGRQSFPNYDIIDSNSNARPPTAENILASQSEAAESPPAPS